MMNPDRPLGYSGDANEYESAEYSANQPEATDYSLSLRDRQLRAFFEGALDAMVIADDEGIYVDANPAACKLFGLPRHELLGHRIVDFAEPGFDFDAAWQAFQLDQQVTVEFRLVRHDGQLRIVECAATANFFPHRHLSVLRDITERKQAEAELKLNEARYRAIVEDQTELICRSRSDGTLTFVNQAYCRYFGKRPEELIGHSFMPMIPDEERAVVEQQFLSISPENSLITYEHHVILASGEVRWQEWVDRGIFDVAGKLVEIQSVGRDITKQKEAELALQQLNQELEERIDRRTAELHRALDYLAFHADNSPLGFIGWDRKLRIQFWSQRAEQIFGWTASEVLGKSWNEVGIVHEDDLAEAGQVIARLSRGEDQVIHRNRSYRKDGTLLYCEWYASAQLDGTGKVVSVLALVQDISERKRAEEALRQRELLLQQAQRIAHVGSWEFDLGTQGITWSEEMFRIYGLDPLQKAPSYPELLTLLHPDDSEQLRRVVERTLQTGMPYEIEHRILRPDGSMRYLVGRGEAIVDSQGNVVKLFGAGIDITERKLFEEQLRQSEARLISAQRVAHVGSWELDISTQKIRWSKEAFYIFGFDPNQPEPSYEEHLQKIHPVDRDLVQLAVESIITTGEPCTLDFRILKSDGSLHYVEGKGEASVDSQGQVIRLFGTLLDITERKQLEAELRSQAEREQLLRTVTQHIHQSLDLDEILTTTVTEIRQVLQTDRVLIYRFQPEWSGFVAVESVIEPWTAIVGTTLRDPCFRGQYVEAYKHGHIQVLNDTHNTQATPCYVEFLEAFQVRATLVVPILQGNEDPQSNPDLHPKSVLWGLLIAQQCNGPRHWQANDIELMKQLAAQAAIAIQQAEFHRQVQRFNAELERQVRARTGELQLAYEFESTLKRITDRVRDSLDEGQILQSAVEELAKGLGVICCNAALFDLEQGTSTICYEYTTGSVAPSQGRVSLLSKFPELYSQLLQGQYFQFCSLVPNPVRGRVAMLSCPIFDNLGVLGDLWLINQSFYSFSAQDIRLVQQVANQCAIALRQSHLYQTAQAQVQELERLNQLKDDFLSTVSHELRTPMSNIKMATQMLEINLNRSEALETQTNSVGRYFQILKDECQREINLINDLLDLTRLDAGTETLIPAPVILQDWLPPIVKPFVERAHSQRQQFLINIPAELPPLTTDVSYLERILTELLNNACKYTPAGESITVSAELVGKDKDKKDKRRSESNKKDGAASPAPSLDSSVLQVSVTNSGVEIPDQELSRVFDKFYRLPQNDPWKHGGTGLGLALVKILVERLGGWIQVNSIDHQTRFTVEFPLQRT